MNRRRRLQLVIVLLLVLAVSGVGRGSAAQTPVAFAAGEILVKFKVGTSSQAIAAAHRQARGQVKTVIPGIGVQAVRVPAGQEAVQAATYMRNPNVLFAETNGLYHVSTHGTKDPLVGQQWQYNNTGQTGGTPDADIAISGDHFSPYCNSA